MKAENFLQGRKVRRLPESIQKSMLIAALTVLLFLADWAVTRRGAGNVNGIERENHARTVQLVAQAEDGTPAPVTVRVQPKEISAEEAAALTEEAAHSLREEILGDNTDLEHVSQNLKLITQTEEGRVTVSWRSSSPSVIDAAGNVNTDALLTGEEKPVQLTAQIEAGSVRHLERIDVTVCAPRRSKEQEFQAQVRKAVESAEEDSRGGDEFVLPEEIAGQKVTFAGDSESAPSPAILIIGGAAAAAFPAREQQKKRQDEKKRRDLLGEDYSELVLKITLFIGAGMTVRRAFERIAQGYISDRKAGVTEKRPAYEAIVQTVRALRLGAPETESWVRFGQMCGTREYRKLGSCLAENQRKGSGHLTRILEAEAAGSFEERKRQARQRGEEAATRLILPLMLMLGAVMAIILVPALMSFAV